MASLGYKIKKSILKGMEAVGSKAASLASNAQSKLSEIELEKQRHELLNEFPIKAMELMHSGVELPKTLTDILDKVQALDEQLMLLRAERYANLENKNGAAAKETDSAVENTEAEAADEATAEEPAAEDENPAEE